MWIEAIVTKDDFTAVLDQILPVKIHFDEDEKTDRWLYLDRPTAIELVPEKGLRVACPAEIMWSVSVVDIPIKLHTLQVLLRPEIVTKQRGDILVFNLTLEEADIKGIPSLIDHTIMKAVNEGLARKELAWDFTKTLTNTVKMPKLLDPIDSLTIGVAWGKRRVDDNALVLVVSFNLTFNRAD
jgi:hypothetical protein